MKRIRNLILILTLPLTCLAQFTISGKILNQADTKPLANTNVFLSNATIGDRTKADGTFRLTNIKPGKYTLVVSMVGFESYSQSVLISDGNLALSDIFIFPKTILLNEVKIKPIDDHIWERNYAWFKEQFLGTSALSNECRILNPEILDLNYDESKNELTASSTDFLEIENNALGYRVKYLLSSFVMNNKEINAISFSYQGYTLFSEMAGTAAQQKSWQKMRQQVYEGSAMHFFRSALDNRIEEEGFRVLRLAKYPNPERPAEKVITAKIAAFKGDNHHRDSLLYWQKKAKLAVWLQAFVNVPLNRADLVTETKEAGIYTFGCDNDDLNINYNKSQRFPSNISLARINYPGNTDETFVSFNAAYALFDNNGAVTTPASLTYSGAWIRNRVEALLPVDYEPVQNKIANHADSSVLKNIFLKLKTYSDSHLSEKVYLHLDSPWYNEGDTIWYKAYTVVGQNHQLSALSGVLYVELISPKDSVVSRQILHLTSGAAWGDIVLTGAIRQGDYRLRAYTNWMRNAGPEYFFNEKIHIGGYDAPPPVKQIAQANPDVQFFPEGGELVNGLRSKIAVKAVNRNGLGQDIKGTIEDNEGNVIVDFATQHLGMGAFAFNPQSGKTYKARIKTGIGETAFEVDLLKAKEAGFTLGINNSRPDSIFLKVAANEALFQQKQHSAFYVIAQTGGKVYYTAKSTLEDMVFTAAIDKKRFPSGIVQFTLFSESGEPLNERSAFIQNNDTLQLKINNPVKTFTTGQKVTFDLDVKNPTGKPVMGAFSAAVTNESMLLGDEASDNNIFSSLLLSSDLKGYVEKPGYYFTNANDQTNADLDVLMLTQGYQRFEWKPILNNTPPQITYQPETSLELAGSINTYSGKPVPHAKISLIAAKDNFLTDTVTDADGNFIFKNLDLPDSAKVLLSAKKINNNNNVNISINKQAYPPVIKEKQSAYVDAITAELPVTTKPDSVQKRMQQITDLRNRRMLKEVTIKGHKIYKREDPDLTYSTNMNGPGHADQIIMQDDLDGCVTLTDCLTGKLRGIDIKGGKAINLRTHGMHQSPIMSVSIDGAISKDINLDDINPNIIHSIEVLSSVSTYSVYGIDIGGGVLVITTKHGKDYVSKDQAPGTLIYNFRGFYKAHEFYSPKYDKPQSNTLASDLRGTIYWNPNIITGTDGKATLNYYNGGTKGTYRVVIEGIDDEGNLGRLVYRYKLE